MMKGSFGFVFSLGAIVLLSIAAFWQLFWLGRWQAVSFIAISGTAVAVGMRSGIENAPDENRKIQYTRVQSVLVYILIFTVISTPAIVVGVFAGKYVGIFVGVVSAISSAWLMCVAIAVTSKLLDYWVGTIKCPEMPAKN